MKKLNKKGFTLTEMIVVIAIIGILAGVLIPTITGYIKKAQLSNDQQLAASMTDEIERYCIENNVSQKKLTGTDVRTILVGKEAVEVGLINEIGGIAEAFCKLKEFQEFRNSYFLIILFFHLLNIWIKHLLFLVTLFFLNN